MGVEKDLDLKVASLRRLIHSSELQDVADSAQLLADLLKTFSVSFNVEPEQILEIALKKSFGTLSLSMIR